MPTFNELPQVSEAQGAAYTLVIQNGVPRKVPLQVLLDWIQNYSDAPYVYYPTPQSVPESQFSAISQDQPAFLTPTAFGDLETQVVRITDATRTGVHDYATQQAFNADQSLLLLTQSGGVWINTSDWSEARRKDTGTRLQFADPVNKDLWWGSQNWTNRIGRYNFATDASVTTWVVPPPSGSAYTAVHIGQGEGSISDDGRYLPVVCLRGDSNVYVAVWDTSTNSVEGTLTLTGWEISGSSFDNAHISPSGQWVVVSSYQANNRGHRIYDRATLTYQRAYTGGSGTNATNGFPGHMDMGYRTNGDEVMVRSRTDGALVSVRLSDLHEQVEIPAAAMSWSFHVSCRNIKRPGWAYVTMAYDNSQSSKYLYREILAVKLDGSGTIERYGQAMFPNNGDYALQGKGVVSPLGDMLLFTSGWGTTTPREYVAFKPAS